MALQEIIYMEVATTPAKRAWNDLKTTLVKIEIRDRASAKPTMEEVPSIHPWISTT